MFEEFAKQRVDCGEATINCVIGGSGPPVLVAAWLSAEPGDVGRRGALAGAKFYCGLR
jgi:hypothetical protein